MCVYLWVCMCGCVCVYMLWSLPAVHTLAAWTWDTWPPSIHLPCCSSFTPFSPLLKAELCEPFKRVVFVSHFPFMVNLFALSNSFINFQAHKFSASTTSAFPRSWHSSFSCHPFPQISPLPSFCEAAGCSVLVLTFSHSSLILNYCPTYAS